MVLLNFKKITVLTIHVQHVIIPAMSASAKNKKTHNTPVENLRQRTWSIKGNFEDHYYTEIPQHPPTELTLLHYLLLQPFPLITGGRSLQPDISRWLKASPLLWSCVRCIKWEAVCLFQDKSSTRYQPVKPLLALHSWLKGEVESKRRSPRLN